VTAKSLSLAHKIPFIGVHHIEGHIMAPFVSDANYQQPKEWSFPFLSLVVSGGHTSLYLVHEFLQYKLLGSTIDDAAGEAFDKFAKMLGLPYPGGVHIDKLSQSGSVGTFHFPRALIHEDGFNFSFSGLKTAAQNLLNKMTPPEKEQNINHLCASYQKAITDVLVDRIKKAILKYKVKSISVTGGVSANSSLRAEIEALARSYGVQLAIPPLRYCTDNAAMIARAGMERLKRGESSSLDLKVLARSEIS
jgi:N6-L-threonylcarbamoyladenine synthase